MATTCSGVAGVPVCTQFTRLKNAPPNSLALNSQWPSAFVYVCTKLPSVPAACHVSCDAPETESEADDCGAQQGSTVWDISSYHTIATGAMSVPPGGGTPELGQRAVFIERAVSTSPLPPGNRRLPDLGVPVY